MVQMRKVILADSLGETSVSVENVSYVICSGKRRVYRFDPVKKVVHGLRQEYKIIYYMLENLIHCVHVLLIHWQIYKLYLGWFL